MPDPAMIERIKESSDARQKISVGLKPDIFQMPLDDLKNTMHIVTQLKGGTGKTYVAATLASFFQRHAADLDLYCFDLDSNKQSFSAFKAFCASQASEVISTEDGIELDTSVYDEAFSPMLSGMEKDAVAVMDTGAAGSFWAVVQYIVNLDYPALVRSLDRKWRFVMHVVISGNAVEESIETLAKLRQFVNSPYVEFVIWSNEYFGNLKGVYSRIVREYGEMFQRNINLPAVPDKRLDAILRQMREKNLSVSEMLAEPMPVLDKARLNQYYYGSQAGKYGVFRALQQLDWSMPDYVREMDAGCAESEKASGPAFDGDGNVNAPAFGE